MVHISNVTDLIRDQMEMANRMHGVLGIGGHTMVLTGYQEKWEEGVQWYSPPYYTHSQGYKMCVSVDFRRARSCLPVYSYLLPGEYDDGLKWPFRGTVVVLLLNQLSDYNHYDYVFDYSHASNWESRRLASDEKSDATYSSTSDLRLNALEYKYRYSKECQYLKNDCLKFKIIVKNLELRTTT